LERGGEGRDCRREPGAGCADERDRVALRAASYQLYDWRREFGTAAFDNAIAEAGAQGPDFIPVVADAGSGPAAIEIEIGSAIVRIRGTGADDAYLAQQSIVAIFSDYGAADRSVTSEHESGFDIGSDRVRVILGGEQLFHKAYEGVLFEILPCNNRHRLLQIRA
jgi:hypothetical protein